MKHITTLTKTPAPAQSVLQAFIETKRETIQNATNLKYFL